MIKVPHDSHCKQSIGVEMGHCMFTTKYKASLRYIYKNKAIMIYCLNDNRRHMQTASFRIVFLGSFLHSNENHTLIMATQDWLSKRKILWILVFFGFAVNYMIRVNLNIAIVSMVEKRYKNTTVRSECFEESGWVPQEKQDFNITTATQPQDESRYHWDETEQAHILGGFFWLHWVTQVPGGILAKKYGTKLIFGLSNFISCLLAMFIPFCAPLGYQAIVFLRIIQGIIAGLAWPSMHNMAALWIPPDERSTFVSAYLGSSVGAALTFPMCGYLINWFDWPSVFYATGIIGAIWFTSWWILVYDTPSRHPTISEKEKAYIDTCIGDNVTENKLKTPWKEILLSKAVWINILVQWGNIWGLFTLLTQAPTYFKNIHGMSVQMTGILSGIPHVCRVVFALVFSVFGDHLLKTNKMSRTWVRKLATIACTIVHGIFILGVGYSGCNSMAAVICLMLAIGVSGAVSTGPLACLVDIGPNFASIILGISNMITVVPGFISPIIVGYLTYQNQTSMQWQIVFIISAFMMIVPGILYLFFATSEIQRWNVPYATPYVSNMKELHTFTIKTEEEQIRLKPESSKD